MGLKLSNRQRTALHCLAGALAFALFAVLLLCFPTLAGQGVKSGLTVCAAVVIPALFPFTAAAVFLQKSGVLYWLSRRRCKALKLLLGLNAQEGGILLLSLLGGYPIGARLLGQAYQNGQLDRRQALRLLAFCVNAGPTFYLAVLGKGLFGNLKTGLCLLGCNALSVLCLSALSRFIAPKNFAQAPKLPPLPPLTDSFVESVTDAALTMLSLSAWVVLFSCFGSILKGLLPGGFYQGAALAALEVTGGCLALRPLGCSPAVLAFFTAFGGLSVLFQVKYSAGTLRPPLWYLIFSSLLRAVLSAAFAKAALALFPTAAPCLALQGGLNPVLQVDYRCLFLILFLAVFLLFTLKPAEKLPKFVKKNQRNT